MGYSSYPVGPSTLFVADTAPNGALVIKPSLEVTLQCNGLQSECCCKYGQLVILEEESSSDDVLTRRRIRNYFGGSLPTDDSSDI